MPCNFSLAHSLRLITIICNKKLKKDLRTPLQFGFYEWQVGQNSIYVKIVYLKLINKLINYFLIQVSEKKFLPYLYFHKFVRMTRHFRNNSAFNDAENNASWSLLNIHKHAVKIQTVTLEFFFFCMYSWGKKYPYILKYKYHV